MPASRKKNSKAANQQRLTRTLGALVVSMGGVALLLNWAYGVTTGTAAVSARTLMLARADNGLPWSHIVVRSASARAKQLPFHHFRIDLAGREQITSAWRDEGRDSADANAIVITIMHERGAGGVTHRQWQALIDRVRELEARYQLATPSVTIDTTLLGKDSDMRRDAEQLGRMLQAAGLMG